VQVHTDLFVLQPKGPRLPRDCELTVARLLNSVDPIHFSVFVHLDIKSSPAVKEGIGIVVLMPAYVMRYPFDLALLKHCSGSGDRIKIRCRRLGDVVDVCIIQQSGETVTPKVDRPGGDVMKRTNLATHSSNAKESGHFAAVRTLICRSTWYNVCSLAPIFL
jgi:hypothetical protein